MKVTVGMLAIFGLAIVGGVALLIRYNPLGLGQKVQELGSAHPYL